MLGDKEVTEQEARFVPAMWPKWLPFEHRQEFADRFNRAVKRHFERTQKWPVYKERARILAGLYSAFKLGFIGNKKLGYRLSGYRAARAAKKKIESMGYTLREFGIMNQKLRRTHAQLTAQRAAEAQRQMRHGG